MSTQKERLTEAERIACELFSAAVEKGLIKTGKKESELNREMFELAAEMFGIEKYWHKRIVRAGANTLLPYKENPPDLTLREDEVIFFDFGPIIEDWEADVGRTYVIGNDHVKHKLKNDVEAAWKEAREWFSKKTSLSGQEYFHYVVSLASKYGWEFGGEIAGHLIGQFPHERLEPGNYGLYVHPENPNDMFQPDAAGNKRHWILEIHFVDREKQIGGFYEQLLT